LVEDNEALADATAEFLRSEGLEVQIASTGDEALAFAGKFRPDIILCDWRLPDMGGVDIARTLRKDPFMTKTVFVIHTAFRKTDIGDGDIPDVDLFLSKPLTQEKLERLLELSRRPRIARPLGLNEKFSF
jgi:CheY-like chemotaxis protein